VGSKTKKTRTIRKNKLKKQGAKRKANDRNKGTTPKFSIHPEG